LILLKIYDIIYIENKKGVNDRIGTAIMVWYQQYKYGDCKHSPYVIILPSIFKLPPPIKILGGSSSYPPPNNLLPPQLMWKLNLSASRPVNLLTVVKVKEAGM
jgi:hypothetical protein